VGDSPPKHANLRTLIADYEREEKSKREKYQRNTQTPSISISRLFLSLSLSLFSLSLTHLHGFGAFALDAIEAEESVWESREDVKINFLLLPEFTEGRAVN
jgi:hypothetical protein